MLVAPKHVRTLPLCFTREDRLVGTGMSSSLYPTSSELIDFHESSYSYEHHSAGGHVHHFISFSTTE
jgi:hypothetical protein